LETGAFDDALLVAELMDSISIAIRPIHCLSANFYFDSILATDHSLDRMLKYVTCDTCSIGEPLNRLYPF
jgi:hypothetical protein